MADLRIFSYLPNPRIWKATIAARINGVEVDIRGASPAELRKWVWDFDARVMSDEESKDESLVRQGRTGFSGELHKTDEFLRAHPFGTVPAAFSPDGQVGIFESNSIMRAVARLGHDSVPLYGTDPYEASRIDSFLDASLVFARDSQIYLLSFGGESTDPAIHASASTALGIYLSGVERGLEQDYLVGSRISIADICFVAEVALFSREKAAAWRLSKTGLSPIWDESTDARYPRAVAHFRSLCQREDFMPDVGPYLTKLEADIDRSKARSDSV